MDTEAIFEWLFILDNLDYYEILGIPRDAEADAIRTAFHVFASSFHPDGHAGRTDDEREALDHIFKRGTEAYAALMDPASRASYDAELAQPQQRRPPRTSIPPPGRGASAAPPRLEDKTQSPDAKPFARKAEELFEKGDLRQAKLNMVMAVSRDPGNDALAEYLKAIEEGIRQK